MALFVATLGFHPEKLLQAIPGSQATEVWYYVAPGTTQAKQARVERAIQTVERTLSSLRLPFRRLDLPHPFDYLSTLKRFLNDLRDARDRSVVFNLTGGPKTMTVAATVACLLLGIPVVYVPEEEPNARPMALPIIRMRYVHLLTPRMHRILTRLLEQGPSLPADLARDLGMAHSTLDYHLVRLDRLGALEWILEGRRRKAAVSDVGRALLLGSEAGSQPETG